MATMMGGICLGHLKNVPSLHVLPLLTTRLPAEPGGDEAGEKRILSV